MTKINPKHKYFELRSEAGLIRTDTSVLLAADHENKFLFRAINSDYFKQDDNDESITIVDTEEAEKIWNNMPIKIVSDLFSAIPNNHVKK